MPYDQIPESQAAMYIGLNDHGDLAGFWLDGSFMMHGMIALRK